MIYLFACKSRHRTTNCPTEMEAEGSDWPLRLPKFLGPDHFNGVKDTTISDHLHLAFFSGLRVKIVFTSKWRKKKLLRWGALTGSMQCNSILAMCFDVFCIVLLLVHLSEISETTWECCITQFSKYNSCASFIDRQPSGFILTSYRGGPCKCVTLFLNCGFSIKLKIQQNCHHRQGSKFFLSAVRCSGSLNLDKTKLQWARNWFTMIRISSKIGYYEHPAPDWYIADPTFLLAVHWR